MPRACRDRTGHRELTWQEGTRMPADTTISPHRGHRGRSRPLVRRGLALQVLDSRRDGRGQVRRAAGGTAPGGGRAARDRREPRDGPDRPAVTPARPASPIGRSPVLASSRWPVPASKPPGRTSAATALVPPPLSAPLLVSAPAESGPQRIQRIRGSPGLRTCTADSGASRRTAETKWAGSRSPLVIRRSPSRPLVKA